MKNSSLLIVDDVFQIRHCLAQYFLNLGYHVFTANSGASAYEATERTVPNLIILDYNLRDMDCFQFLSRLRKYESTLRDVVKHESIPVIIISGYSIEDKIKMYSKKYGISAFFSKPLNLNELNDEVESLLGQKKKSNVSFTKDIIILDSEERTAKFLSGFLGKFNCNTTGLYNIYDFIENVEMIKPDLIIYDIHIDLDTLTNFNPIDFVKKHNRKAKVFLTTFCNDDTYKNTFKHEGFDKLFVKPINLKQLEEEVAIALKQSGNLTVNTSKESIDSLLASINCDYLTIK